MTNETKDIKVVVDLETTGLDYKREKIIEFAGIILENNEIKEEFEVLIDPQQEIRPSSIEIHGITPEMVKGAPTIEEIMPKILDFIKDYPIVAHNAIFDHSFLNQASRDLYGKNIPNSKIDTFQMYREVFPEEHSHGMESLLKRFNIEFNVRHRAMADAKGLACVYPHLELFYKKKCEWQLSQINNIEYLFERYLRIQNTVQILQAEMADLKSLFKVYFQENGSELTATTGEILTCYSKPSYNYNTKMMREVILNNVELHEKAFKLNTGYIERIIRDSDTEENLRQLLMECRSEMKESLAVSILKPEKAQAVYSEDN
ncbi:MAG TPA: 3'-5' exonuclease [Candidatus Gastranaerophilales bacterium]|nr:3'-5' exonuclease [Candidatus Gastranaerophilales bacterium]